MRKTFSQLTKAEKRVAIAKDVIAQVNEQRYYPVVGRYIEVPEEFVDSDKDIKSTLKDVKNCSVCAMGACLLSITKFENKLKWNQVGTDVSKINNSSVRTLFLKIFTPRQLYLIETAFEGLCERSDRIGTRIFGLEYDEGDAELRDADNFNHISSDDERLITIMKNIIKNKGTFKPGQHPLRIYKGMGNTYIMV